MTSVVVQQTIENVGQEFGRNCDSVSDLACVSTNILWYLMLLKVEGNGHNYPLLGGETGRKIMSYSVVSDSLL